MRRYSSCVLPAAVGPITAVAVRSVVALPAILIAYVVAVHVLKVKTEPPTWFRADARTLWTLVIGSGLFAGGAALICFYAALNLGDISRIKPIAFTIAPATAVLLGHFLLHEDMSPRKLVAIVMILGGVVLLTGVKKPAPASPEASVVGTEEGPSR